MYDEVPFGVVGQRTILGVRLSETALQLQEAVCRSECLLTLE
jgi:hypothetical protein